MASRTQISMYAFITFTVFQILIFLYRPEIYNNLAPGLDVAPEFKSVRLIGLKEIGLMCIYCVGTYLNDYNVIIATIAGRGSVLFYTIYIVFVLGAPQHFLFGILQDLFFSAWTYWELTHEPKSAGVYQITDKDFNSSPEVEGVLRLAIVIAGVLEARVAVIGFMDTAQASTDVDNVAFENVGYLSFAFMSFLVGTYQVYFACVGVHDAVLFTIAFHHLNFFFVVSNIGFIYNYNWASTLVAPPFHLHMGLLILVLASFNQLDQSRARINSKSG